MSVGVQTPSKKIQSRSVKNSVRTFGGIEMVNTLVCSERVKLVGAEINIRMLCELPQERRPVVKGLWTEINDHDGQPTGAGAERVCRGQFLRIWPSWVAWAGPNDVWPVSWLH
jgi:hypothetical protein